MPKPIKQGNPRTDVNQLAQHLLSISTIVETEPVDPLTSATISRYFSEMGKKGGKIGGKRRLETMTPEERRSAASKAAKARWKGAKKTR